MSFSSTTPFLNGKSSEIYRLKRPVTSNHGSYRNSGSFLIKFELYSKVL
nr:3334_t:CDS:2 [Entrophospora candida]